MIASDFQANISKRIRRRQNRAGKRILQTRFVLSFRCPDSGRRTQRFFENRADAEQARSELIREVDSGHYVDPRRVPTIGELVDHWLEVRRSEVKASTFQSYGVVAKLVTGPILEGTATERAEFTATGAKPTSNTRMLPMLGRVKANDLSTAMIRRWHALVREQVAVTAPTERFRC